MYVYLEMRGSQLVQHMYVYGEVSRLLRQGLGSDDGVAVGGGGGGGAVGVNNSKRASTGMWSEAPVS